MNRVEFKMSEDDLAAIMDASKPTPLMYLSGGQSMSPTPQENANSAWKKLGNRLGFDHMTVSPASGKGQRFFTAIKKEPL